VHYSIGNGCGCAPNSPITWCAFPSDCSTGAAPATCWPAAPTSTTSWLLQARGQRSLLVVAHRLSTVTTADQILVLQDGRIQATGTHTELMRMPIYRELVEHELAQS
jgi:hypothetical protein